MIKDSDRRKLYHVWYSMLRRCNNPNHKSYKYYGGQGITVCSDWNNFESFYNWSLNNGYQSDLTLDRINSNHNYEPSNCRWVDWYTQENNRSICRRLVIDGVNKTITEWSRETGIPSATIRYRISHGFSPKDAVTIPITNNWIPIIYDSDSESAKKIKNSYIKFIQFFDESMYSMVKIANLIGISRSCLNEWKSGRYLPTKEHMKQIADYLGVDVNYFS